MKVLVVGSGGREHALVWKIKQSPLVDKIYAAPGNAGIAEDAECVAIKAEALTELRDFAVQKKIDLTVVGPEVPLVEGIVDLFQASRLGVFGPTREGARLEGSKIFSKQLMSETGVPTAPFKVVDHIDDAKKYILDRKPPYVIKADGLAAGKGVLISRSSEEAIQAVGDMLKGHMFGDAGKRVLIEECLEGDELSVLLFTDGERIVPLASSQDHKRVFDDDEGPNTGGMGAYSPCPLVTDRELADIIDQTAKPVINELRRRKTPYRGLLYVGIMMTSSGPHVLEYNVRFGDPEAQAVLPRLKSDIVPIMREIAHGTLRTLQLEWDSRACMTVVMASGGYPGSYDKGLTISGLGDILHPDMTVFHAGTKKGPGGQMVTSGGRVLAVSALGDSLKDAFEGAYDAMSKISFQGAHYRKDIGRRAFEKTGVG